MHLTDAQIRRYEEVGFLQLGRMFSPEEVALLAAAADVLGTPRRGLADANVYEKQSGMIRKSYAMDKDSLAFFLLTRLPRLLTPARQLLGEHIYLWMTHMNHKVAHKGELWQWHQDYTSWWFDGAARGGIGDMVSFMIMLDESTPDNGPLMMLKGSHKLPMETYAYDTETTSYPVHKVSDERMAELAATHENVACLGPAGSVVMFAPLAIHGSGENRSARGRRNAYIVYNRTDNRPVHAESKRRQVTPHLLNRDPVEIVGTVADGALGALARSGAAAA